MALLCSGPKRKHGLFWITQSSLHFRDRLSIIESDHALSYSLRRPNSTAEKVLEHASMRFKTLLARYEPMTCKFSITRDAYGRFYNGTYGYRVCRERFVNMHVVYAAANQHGQPSLETDLISLFGSHMPA